MSKSKIEEAAMEFFRNHDFRLASGLQMPELYRQVFEGGAKWLLAEAEKLNNEMQDAYWKLIEDLKKLAGEE